MSVVLNHSPQLCFQRSSQILVAPPWFIVLNLSACKWQVRKVIPGIRNKSALQQMWDVCLVITWTFRSNPHQDSRIWSPEWIPWVEFGEVVAKVSSEQRKTAAKKSTPKFDKKEEKKSFSVFNCQLSKICLPICITWKSGYSPAAHFYSQLISAKKGSSDITQPG